MKRVAGILVTTLCLFITTDAQAERVEFKDGALRIEKVGNVSNLGKWFRNKTIVIALPPSGLSAQRFEVDHPPYDEVIVDVHRSAAQVELRLEELAEPFFKAISIENINGDLIVKLPKVAPSIAPTQTVDAPKAVTKQNAAPEKGNRAKPLSITTATHKSTGLGPKQSTQLIAKKPAWLTTEKKSAGMPMWGYLGVAMLMFGGLLWFSRKRIKPADPKTTQIQILATKALSNKHRLLLVDVAGDQLLLATSEQGIRLIRPVGRHGGRVRDTTRSRGKSDNKIEHEFFTRGDIESESAQYEDDDRDAVQLSVREHRYLDHRDQGHVDNDASPKNFVSRLTEHLQRKRLAKLSLEGESGDEFDAEPHGAVREAKAPVRNGGVLSGGGLDEQWAEGILRLRRQRQGAAVRQHDAMQNYRAVH